jgi:hypothetical protein
LKKGEELQERREKERKEREIGKMKERDIESVIL